MKLRVAVADEQRIAEMQTRQTFHAHSIGVMLLSYLLKRKQYLAENPVDLVKLGALEVERSKQEKFWLDKVTETEVMQRAVGEKALRNVGIDYDKGDYTIISGNVMELKEGNYVPVER